MSYRRILVPHDCSEISSAAVTHAINIANIPNQSISTPSTITTTTIILIHVVQGFPIPHLFERSLRSYETGKIISTSFYMKEIYQQIRDNVYITLSREQKRCIKKGIKNTQIQILQGKPARSVVDMTILLLIPSLLVHHLLIGSFLRIPLSSYFQYPNIGLIYDLVFKKYINT